LQVASSVLVVVVAVLGLVDEAPWLIVLTALVCVLVGLGAVIAPRNNREAGR
jgi:hypothetical protein